MMIKLYDLSPAVQRLAQIGSPGAWEQLPWLKYEELGISKKHIVDLVEIIRRFDDFWEYGLDNPQAWTPIHAWRALGQLRAEEALPVLGSLLLRLNDHDNDLIQEDLPKAFGLIGRPAIPVLLEYLLDQQRGHWVQAAAADGLQHAALNHPDTRDEAVAGLVRALENYPTNPPILNSLLIRNLRNLADASPAGLVEQVFASTLVDPGIGGDWDDFQVATGLSKKRRTPRPAQAYRLAAFRDGLSPEEEEASHRGRKRIWLKRHKQKRKLIMESRKISHKKKKK